MKTKSDETKCPKCGAPIPADAPQNLCPKCILMNAETLAAQESSPRGKAPPRTLEELAPHFPDLEILELIGTGGMGAVYKARQPNLDRFVALKVLSQELVDDPAFAERFGREARVLAKLSHPNIVGVYDSGTKGPYAYLLMEYVDGVNLRQAMRSGGFSPTEALTLVEDICAALKFAHAKGILHRDIKPENVLIDADGQVKIADFGIAKLVGIEDQYDVTLTSTGSILGSPQYMAPEQIESPGDVDQRADIYSLGVVLYEMLTGELPLGRFALPSQKVQLDARIDEIVLRTLEKEREARFQSADEVQTSVEAVRTSPGSVARPRRSDAPSETARFAIVSAILAGVVVLFGLFGYVEWVGSPPVDADAEPNQLVHPAEAPDAEPGSDPETATSELPQIMDGEPRVDLNLSVAPGLVATYKLIETDAVGEERRLGGHHGFILAADEASWQGTIQLATTDFKDHTPTDFGWRKMWSSIRSDSPEVENLDDEDRNAGKFCTFDPEWAWEEMEPLELALSEPGQHIFQVATRVDESKLLSLRVEVRPRAVPGVPSAVLDPVELEKTVCGLGSDIDWIRYLMEEVEKQMEASGVSGPVREPDPEWRNGHPEKHCILTVPAGMVATFKLVGADGEIHQQGYIVASDLEPWVGKLRAGSLAGNSEMQLRLEGPFNTITANIEQPDTWVLEPDAYTQTLDNTKTTYFTFLGRVQPDDPSDSSKEFVKLALKVEPRKYQGADAGLAEVLAFHHMALGKAPDWIFGLKQVFEITDPPQPGRSR